jgi:hypothetical protein
MPVLQNPLWVAQQQAASYPWAYSGNTGFQNAPGYPGSLTPFSGTITSNTTYNYRSFSGGADVGTAGSPVTNVTFNGCEFDSDNTGAATAVLLYGDGLTFSYCTIRPTGLTSPPASNAQGYQYALQGDGGFSTSVQALTVQHCDIWGFAEAIDVSGGTQAKPHTYLWNWIHDPRNDGGVDHTDGLGAQSGTGTESYCVISRNNIQALANTNGIAFQGGTYDHMTVSGNLFGGYGYTIHIGDTVSFISFTDNTFSTALLPTFAPVYPVSFWTATGSAWKRNKWLVPPGAQWGDPAHNGYFWLPVSSTIVGTDDTPYVSLTDF